MEIENILQSNGRSLKDYPPMPILNSLARQSYLNKLVAKELNCDKEALQMKYSRLKGSMIDEQKNISI